MVLGTSSSGNTRGSQLGGEMCNVTAQLYPDIHQEP